MKLSKLQTKRHGEAESLLSLSRKLNQPEREFCLTHWLPGATGNIGIHGVFFTPESIATSFPYEGHGATIDACAGIGRLAYHCWQASMWSNDPRFSLTCVEFNSQYYEVGKRILPEAEWIRADLADYAKSLDGKRPFRNAISNPPYGRVPTLQQWKHYSGPAHLVAAAILGDICTTDVRLLIPENDICQDFQRHTTGDSSSYTRFRAAFPHLSLNHASFDFSEFRNEWIGASPNVTLATLDGDYMALERAA